MTQAQSTGTVYLVGAGPGDPELITVRGLRCLQHADVVVYDRLANEDLLDECPEWSERIFAGKAPGLHSMTQEQINAVLVDRAIAGLTVVRLKGGDPFVLGRGGEEAIACAEAGVAFEVVPGISSTVAAPSAAGIPLTHRGVAGSFSVVTGHRMTEDVATDWEALARTETLVILMGVANLALIADRLIAAGRAGSTPVAIVERATHTDQRTTVGTLESIVELARENRVRSPATIVVGEVVSLRQMIGDRRRIESAIGSEIRSFTG